MQLTDLNKFQSISIDTRTLQPGDVFVALVGDNFDGHDYIKEAEQKGAIAAVVDHEVKCNIPLIKAEDTCYALGELAAIKRQHADIPVIAITGSCGKTTTKAMLASILNIYGKTLATKENLNNNIGVPLTLLQLQPRHEFAVIEIGANQVHEIAYSAKLAEPNIAVITNAAPVHLEGFSDLDGVARVKGDILQGLTNDGIAILNADDKYFNFWQSLLKGQRSLSFAIQKPADFYAENIIIDEEHRTHFILHSPLGNKPIHLQMVGTHNVMNALAASCSAYAAGASLAAIKVGLETMLPVAQRMLHKKGYNGAVIIDDSYNANPRSMEAALQVLMHGCGEKILVVGDMGELGVKREQYHHKLGIKARELGVHRLYAVGQLTKSTAQAFGEKGYYFTNRNELIAAINAILAPDVTVLVKGSKVNKMWEIVAALLKINEE